MIIYTTSNEVLQQTLAFFMLLSQQAKNEAKRKHHLGAAHLAVMLSIPETFKNGEHLIKEFTAAEVFRTFVCLGHKDKFSTFKRNLNEFVKLGFLKREGNKYSYSIHFEKQNIDNNITLN